jgi:hypothetical protein
LFLNTLTMGLAFGILWVLSFVMIPNGQASYGSYLAQFTSMIFETIKNNSLYYFWLFGHFFDRLIYWNLIYFVVLFFFALGVWANRSQDQVYLIYFGLSILVLLMWPAVQGIRFIFPLLPFFVYYSFQGMKHAALRVWANHNRIVAGAVYGFWSIAVLVFLWATLSQVKNNFQNDRNLSGPFDSYSVQVYEYIAANTRPDSVVIFFKPRAMSLMTDRSSLKIDNCKQLKAGDFDVVDKELGAVGQVPYQALPQCQVRMVKVFENPVFIIYRILNKNQASLLPYSS